MNLIKYKGQFCARQNNTVVVLIGVFQYKDNIYRVYIIQSFTQSYWDRGQDQGTIKLVSVVSRILDTMRLVRHYRLKTTRKLRHNWLDTLQLITILLDTINSDSKGPLTSINT